MIAALALAERRQDDVEVRLVDIILDTTEMADAMNSPTWTIANRIQRPPMMPTSAHGKILHNVCPSEFVAETVFPKNWVIHLDCACL